MSPVPEITRNQVHFIMCKPTVYIDSSTIIDALNSKTGDGRLWAKLEEVSRLGTLILSFTHLVELFGQIQRDEAIWRARWIQSLGIKYLAPWDELLNRELLSLALIAFGAKPPVFDAFSSNLIQRFADSWKPENADEIFRGGSTLEAYVMDTSCEAGQKQIDRWNQLPHLIKKLETDAREHREYLSNIEKGRKVRLEKYLSRLPSEVVRLLNDEDNKPPPDIIDAFFIVGSDSMIATFPAVEAILALKFSPKAFRNAPLAYLVCEFQHRMAHDLASREAKDVMHAAKSDPGDIMHLAGLAYCEIFTCDHKTRSRLNRSWLILGRPEPLTVKNGDATAFPSHEALLEGILERLRKEKARRPVCTEHSCA